MDLQEIMDNAMVARRHKEMKTSDQWVLTELIMALENADPQLPILFDIVPYHPSGLDSWRGSYSELAIEWDNKAETMQLTGDFLKNLKSIVGATVTGYKGGEFVIGKLTPLWIANYGESHGPGGDTIAVVGATMEQSAVIINTAEIEY